MHWCMDETLALLSVIPFIGYLFAKVHNWWHAKFSSKCHDDCAKHDGTAHMEANVIIQSPLESFTCTVDKTWDAGNFDNDIYDLIAKEDLDERLGPITDKLIDKLQFDLDIFLNKNEFSWFINGHSRVKATFQRRTFLHDEFSDDNTWSEIKQ